MKKKKLKGRHFDSFKYDDLVGTQKEANKVPTPNCIELSAHKAAVDLNQMRESNYRRGLVAAMECILRELR